MLWGIHSGLTRTDIVEGVEAQKRRAEVLAALGCEIVRIEVRWQDMQPTEGGAIEWGVVDAAVKACEEHGMQVLLLFNGTPTWVNGGTSGANVPGAGEGTGAAGFIPWAEACAAFCKKLVERYKPSGAAATNVTKYEVWNEPNLGFFWRKNSEALTAGVDPAQFGYLFDLCYAAMKAAYPTGMMALGGVTDWEAVGTGQNGSQFMHAVLTAGGARTLDAICWHAYTGNEAWSPAIRKGGNNNFSNVGNLIELMQARGYGSKPVWITEDGFNTNQVYNVMTDANQAEFSGDVFELIKAYPQVAMHIFYDDVDDKAGGGGFEEFMGMYTYVLGNLGHVGVLKLQGEAFRRGVLRWKSGADRKSRVRIHH